MSVNEGGKQRARSSDAADGTLHYRAISAEGHAEKVATPQGGDLEGQGGAKIDDARMLAISFCAMIVVGLGNKIFQKLQTIPMYNYPNFLNLLTTGMYIPVSFAYVVPAVKAGWISEDQLRVPKRDFAVMGALDSLAGIMQVFAATYLPGSLLVLLTQAAIPISMALSAALLGATYHRVQYAAAAVVCGGILLVLAPALFGAAAGGDDDGDGGGGGDDGAGAGRRATATWAVVLMASCVPMCLSSIYKERALGSAVDLDPVYLNAWIAVFQFAFSLPLAVPAALMGSPAVYPPDLPRNLWEGLRCYAGLSSQTCADGDGGGDDGGGVCHEDQCYLQGPLFVNIYLAFNIAYNVLIVFILKYGSANILWLAMTVMVPLGNLAFALPFMPQHSAITPFDVAGLAVIMSGLVAYRQGPGLYQRCISARAPIDDGGGKLSPLLLDDDVDDHAAGASDQ